MRRRTESAYEMVQKNTQDKSIFSTSGLYDKIMGEWLLVWILEKIDGSLFLEDIHEIVDDLTKVTQSSTKESFFPVFRSTCEGELIMLSDGESIREYSSLQAHCSTATLNMGMPCYQATEKGSKELIEWKRAIAEFLLGLSNEEAVDLILEKLIEARKNKIIPGKISWHRVEARRNPY